MFGTNLDVIDYEKHLLQTFHFSSFRFPQKEIIQRVYGEESLLALMPTGAGKSLSYHQFLVVGRTKTKSYAADKSGPIHIGFRGSRAISQTRILGMPGDPKN